MARLVGKVAIVTGAARGLGAACAKALCDDGAAVLLTDVLDAGARTAETLVKAGAKAVFLKHDVSSEAAWAQAVDVAAQTFGGVDILVNNAGINKVLTVEQASAEDFRAILEVNLIGAFLGIKAVLPVMKARNGGAIINMSSNSTEMTVPQTSIYGASKAALRNLTKTTAVHCARSGYNIRVNSVHPGPHKTAMLFGEDDANPELIDLPELHDLVRAIPMQRMGEPMEVGRVVAFLASVDASYMTGAALFVDGGLTIT